MSAPIGGPGAPPPPPQMGGVTLDDVGKLLTELGYDVEKTKVQQDGDTLKIMERGKTEVLVRLTSSGQVLGSGGPQNPQLAPPNPNASVDTAELAKLVELKGKLVTYGMSIGDVMLFLSKLLSKEKFMNTVMAAEIGVETVKMARQIADFKIKGREEDVKAAQLAVAGAAVSIAMGAVSLAGSAISIGRGASVKKNMMNDNTEDGLPSPQKKYDDAKAKYQKETKSPEHPNGKEWDGRQMSAKERQEFDSLVSKETTINRQHTQWQERNAAGADGTVSGGPGGAQAGDPPPVPMRPNEKQRLSELRAHDDMEKADTNYRRAEQTATERSTMEARNIQMISEQIGHIGQSIGGMMGQIGTIMYAVEAEEWRGLAEVTEATQKLLQNLAQSLVGTDNQESSELHKKVLDMFEQFEALKTRISDFRN